MNTAVVRNYNEAERLLRLKSCEVAVFKDKRFPPPFPTDVQYSYYQIVFSSLELVPKIMLVLGLNLASPAKDRQFPYIHVVGRQASEIAELLKTV